MPAILIDMALAASLVFFSLASLRSKTLFQGIVSFMLFGLLVALAWIRVHAPDLALAEAAIGSGVTGALFLGALSRTERTTGKPAPHRSSSNRTRAVVASVGALALCVALIAAILLMERPQTDLRDPVAQNLEASGVKNPVTAVILNFRAYDTLLEIGVLVLAALGVYSITVGFRTPTATRARPPAIVLTAFTHMMIPLGIVVAAYLLWIGAAAPGGAFQAGALLAGTGITLLLSRYRIPLRFASFAVRLALIAGFLVFLLVGASTAVAGRALLEFPLQAAKILIFAIEAACTVSIALLLTSMFAGCGGLLPDASSSGGEEAA